ncbi:T9SS type A sorting domain-containing protein [Aquimarina sp. ERC-38]|uniref:T9SS type A sorting domain-containing protein n=1 Tax=Aquimarina sp. ERC-38 TaxID=2949996 RepID=UPI002246186E|nr:T9SS type A sorting domain-containing protein [Aquimarina sp. ERC-38]UZO80742.1 T9SS type A sorting domain-containing protein [Aquimarina sp. ERC-38]
MKTTLFLSLIFLVTIIPQTIVSKSKIDSNVKVKKQIKNLNSTSSTDDTFEFTDTFLINADTDQIIATLPNYSSEISIDSDTLQGANLTFQANYVGNADNVIIEFDLWSPHHAERFYRDSIAPYSLFGDDNGDYQGTIFPDGQTFNDEYLVFIRAYKGFVSEENLIDENVAGIKLRQVNIEPSLGFAEVYLNENTLERQFFEEYETSSPSTLTLIIRKCLDCSSNVSSILFNLKGPVEVNNLVNEQGGRYSIFGFSQDRRPARKILPPGSYVIEATPYTGSNGTGIKGRTSTFGFTVGHDNRNPIKINSVQIASIQSDTLYQYQSLSNGQIFNKSEEGLAFNSISSIVANIDSEFVKSVAFDLEGEINLKTIENIFPYALFGDDNGILDLQDFPSGTYKLTVIPYSERNGQGESGTSQIKNFTITRDEQNDPFEFTGFTIINADTDEALSQNRLLYGNTIVNMDGLENANLTLEANFKGNNDGITVEFREEFSQESRIERSAPYVFDGNSGSNYFGKPIPVSNTDTKIFRVIATRGEGENKVIVDEFDKEVFFVSFDDLVSFSDLQIGNPNSDQTFDFFSTTYLLGDSGRIGDGNVGIVVEDRFRLSSPRLVSSVSFSLYGPISYSYIENDRQDNNFSLFGYTDTTFNTRQFVPGDYTFTATPYTGKNATGYKGGFFRINFSIIEEEGQNRLILYPNPANQSTTLTTADQTIISADLYNVQGFKVRTFKNLQNESSTINTSGLPIGYYYLKTVDDKGELKTEKLLIQR